MMHRAIATNFIPYLLPMIIISLSIEVITDHSDSNKDKGLPPFAFHASFIGSFTEFRSDFKYNRVLHHLQASMNFHLRILYNPQLVLARKKNKRWNFSEPRGVVNSLNPHFHFHSGKGSLIPKVDSQQVW